MYMNYIKGKFKQSIYTSDTEIDIKLKQEKKLFGRKIEINYKYKAILQNEKITISEG